MTAIRIATFNCENLFARYRFESAGFNPSGGFTIDDLMFDIHSTRSKRITARAIKEVDADIICLQEVENLDVLDNFNSEFLGGSSAKRYHHRIVVDGNDRRRIDVAFLSRIPFTSIRSHRNDRVPGNARRKVFSRDCLRVDFDISGTPLTLYGNHFKSMIPTRKETRDRRLEQVDRMVAILKEDWGDGLDANFVVMGDLNDYPQNGGGSVSALGALLNHPKIVDPADQLTMDESWTHYWAREDEYRQLDYLLMSKTLFDAAGAPPPRRELRGMPWRADDAGPTRFDDVGTDRPKASDHAPIFVDLDI